MMNELRDLYYAHQDIIHNSYINAEHEINELLTSDHDIIGRVLKCHLVIEYFMNQFVEDKIQIKDIKELNLSFYQKILLIEQVDNGYKFYLEPVKVINKIRNKLAHNIDPLIDFNILKDLKKIVDFVYKDENIQESITLIEKYTVIVCTALKIDTNNDMRIYKERVIKIIDKYK